MSDLLRDLAALTNPGVVPTTVEPPLAPLALPNAPKGWEPGVKFAPHGTSWTVTTTAQTVNVQHDEHAWRGMVEDLGLNVPEGWVVRLVEAKYDPVAWTRDSPEQDKAVTRAVWRYRFAVEPDTGKMHRDDVYALVRDVMRRRRRPPKPIAGARRGLAVVYADPQAGKVDQLGGTRELAERVATAFGLVEDHIDGLKRLGRAPTEAAWLDLGDCIEGFENTTAQAFTNDLTMTEMVRAHRRLTFDGIDMLAARFPKVTAATCGSNHARVRRGKDAVAGPHDDWGIEVLSQVQDGYAKNPAAFGHVQFAYPAPHRDTTLIDLAGSLIGMAHGHQVNRPDAMPEWWKKQAFGEEPVAPARILISGHFHHWRTVELGNGRLWVQAPTLDNGSSWYSMRSGENSHPGVLVFSVTEHGWDDMRILRP